MNKTFTLIGVSIIAASLSLAGATAANASQQKTVICHATSSESNPWVQIEVANPSLKAHAKHGDLIPAPVEGCPVPAVVPPVDVPGDPVDPPVDVPVDPIDPVDPVDPVDPIDPPTEEPVDPPVDVPEEPTPETPVDEPTEPETPVVTPETPVAEVPAAFVPQQLPTLPVTELAYTGNSPLVPAGIASLLLAVGGFLVRKAVHA